MIREIYGKKIGMTQIFSEEGNLLPVTLVDVEPVYLLEKVEYPTKVRARIGCFKIEEKKVSKLKRPVKGYFDKLEVSPYKLIREVEIAEDIASAPVEEKSKPNPEADEIKQEPKEAAKESEAQPEVKQTVDSRQIGIEMFKVGDVVDVRAKTKGRGFAGGMKRHGWSGQPGGHGSTTHRRIGSVGASADPSKIIKGLNMPGHMGNVFRIAKKLTILKVDKDNNLLFIKGSIPGHRGAIVLVKKLGRNHG